MANKRLSHPRLSGLYLWSQAHANGVFLAISAFWVALLYGRGICGAFIYDDIGHIQNNPALSSWRDLVAHYFRAGDIFAHDLLQGGGTSYRPLLWLSLAVDRRIWGLNPCGFHLTNLFLHWANGFLFFILLRRLRMSATIAATVCLLWLGLPVNSESVAWISGRTYPLMCAFLLLSLLAAGSYLAEGSRSALFLYPAALFAALLSNEAGILALPLTIVLAYFKDKTLKRRWLALGIAGLATDGVYLVLRKFSNAPMPRGPGSFAAIGTIFFKYVAWILFPVHMSVERSTDTPLNRLSWISLAALAGIICLLALLYWLNRKNALAAFGLSWMLLALLPFCGIVPIYQGMAERYMYLASFGLVLAITAAASKRAVVFVLLLVWGFWGATRLQARVLDWKDPLSLYQSSLETTPRSVKLTYNLGTAFEASGNFIKATEYYRKALALNPKYVSAMVAIGNIDQRSGNFAIAEQDYLQAASMDPAEGNVYCYLGALLFREGKTDRAIQELSKAIALNPSNPTAYLDLGVVYQKSGDTKRAAQMYAKVLELQPGDPEALTNLQTVRSME